MAKRKNTQPVGAVPSTSDHAALYRVLKGSKPIPMSDGSMATSGDTFRASAVLCYPVQLDAILAAKPTRIEAVKHE